MSGNYPVTDVPYASGIAEVPGIHFPAYRLGKYAVTYVEFISPLLHVKPEDLHQFIQSIVREFNDL